jgi:broad specificity phosphatase PhoE
MLKVNPASKVGLLEWLKTKDPNEEYDWWDVESCAVKQYVKHCGYERFHDLGAKAAMEWNELALECTTFGELRKAVEASLEC